MRKLRIFWLFAIILQKLTVSIGEALAQRVGGYRRLYRILSGIISEYFGVSALARDDKKLFSVSDETNAVHYVSDSLSGKSEYVKRSYEYNTKNVEILLTF